mmetsp:Transcript_6809/g.12137  ORF Transcript_6809/g.12137 Transcript_6809/m.12137 type:complete len:229 (-) Transcript_6809:133-819(-)
MIPPTNSVRLASRAFHNSSRGLAIGGRSVPRCSARSHAIGDMLGCGRSPVRSHRLISHRATSIQPTNFCLPQVLMERCQNIGQSNRYFSGKEEYLNEKGRNDNDDAAKDIDRSKFTHEVKVEMPDVGDDTEGIIDRWFKEEGDIIKPGDVICDIRTKLFTFGMMTDDDYHSIMGEILIPANSDPIKPNTVICKTLNEGGSNEAEEAEEDESKYQEWEGSITKQKKKKK